MKLIYGAVLSCITIGIVGYLIYQSSTQSISQDQEASAPQSSLANTKKDTDRVSSATPENDRDNSAAAKMAAQQQEIAALSRQVAALNEQMPLLRREIAAIQRQQIAGVAANGKTESPDVSSTDPDAKLAEAKESQEEWQKQMEATEVSFQQETSDPNWSSETMEVVQHAFAANESLQAAVRNLDCRSNTCRLELADDGTGGLAKSLPLVLLQLAEALPNAVTNQIEDNNGKKNLVLYLSREQLNSDVSR